MRGDWLPGVDLTNLCPGYAATPLAGLLLASSTGPAANLKGTRDEAGPF
jgi:hypothetical protein